MNKKLVLISRKPIIIQIFTLVCKKLNLTLEVLSEAQIDHKVDIIVVDTEFINDRFNIIKTYSKLIGAISKEELPFEIADDFIVPLPFLPSSLQDILEHQVDILNKRLNAKMYISNVEVEDDTYDELVMGNSESVDTENAVDYLESLADDIASDMNEEIDDSVISLASVNHGGILDRTELSAIEDIINENSHIDENMNDFLDADDEENTEWLDLSSIIDQAISEVNTVGDIYDKFDNKPIRLLLNNYDIEELKPLLSMLDQDIIDSLTDGHEINLQLKFENNDG